jgi:hypothetical protein
MPTVDRSGRLLVTGVLERVIGALGLVEQEDALLPLQAVGGPLDGRRIGEFRVYTGGDVRLVYSRLAVDELGMDTHQVYAFTAPASAVPHLFLDTAISPNTEGTFHFGLDLAPRLDLGANLEHTLTVYTPLDEVRAEAVSRPGVLPVPSLGPLQWTLRSPWMVAAIVAPRDLAALQDVTDAYVDRWLDLVRSGIDSDAPDLAERDRRSRQAMFNPLTNPVWGLLDRLVGVDTAAAMKDLLTSA